MRNDNGRWLKSGTAVAALSLFASAAPVYAQEQTYSFDVPRQDLSTSLKTFARIAHQQVTFSSKAVRGKSAPALKGNFSARAALNILLRNSGLDLESGRTGVFIIRAAGPSASSESAPEITSASTEGSSDIVVTASRTARPGYKAPTPVSVLNQRDLSVGARSNLAASLNDLPQVRSSISASNSGGSYAVGSNPVDLRGLGAIRTLVLLDGKRTIGDNDLALVPSILVKRVELVTGSASAAWGSGAVAGVANIILDDQFSGLRLGAQGSIASRGDAGERRFEGAYGTTFADGRAHMVIGGEFTDNDGLLPKSGTGRRNVARWGIVNNPDYTSTNGQKPLILAPDVGYSIASPGGLILSGVNSGQTFNADGTLRPFNLGRVDGSNSIGGEAPSFDDYIALIGPNKHYSVAGILTYDFGNDVTAKFTMRHGRTYGDYPFFPEFDFASLTISADNAFLPKAIRNQMTAAGETSFTLGRIDADYAFIQHKYERNATQGTLAFDGQINSRFKWSAYYTHGEYSQNWTDSNLRIAGNFANALDSVTSSSGVPICRIALSDPTTNCAPINLFGVGAPSQASRDYLLGTAYRREDRKLDMGGLSVRGTPFDTWAGPVSLAAGAEIRRESEDVNVDALSAASAFQFNNFGAVSGNVTTKEAFVETVVPILKDVPGFRSTELNGAARYVRARGESVWAWKVGMTNEILPGLRVKATHSRDIRAPSIEELFSPNSVNLANISDPQKNNQSYFVRSFIGGGNANLSTEKSNTSTAGLVFETGSRLKILSSIDYYNIDVKNAIVSLAPQDTVSRCAAGNASLCQYVVRDANGFISQISTGLVNLANIKTSGVDVMVDLRLPLSVGGGAAASIELKNEATWVQNFKVSDGQSSVNYVGTLGQYSSYGVPRIKWNSTLYLDMTRFFVSARMRFISAGFQDRNLPIQNNHIAAYAYGDLQAGLRISTSGGKSLELYGNMNNVFDKAPPIGSSASQTYDVIGRYFSVGARINL